MKTTTPTADKVRSSKPELLRAMRAVDAIARATRAAVLRHAQLDESVAMEVDGKVLVVPAKTLV
ncbi:MAG TPA: hypothetical protein VK324_14990 [Tepidisphaeraceae bacterium]|nr:hypothetical protein [Tepidisphaeraceae bacterium]